MRKNSKVPKIIELIEQGCTAKEIVDKVGCTRANVHATAQRYGLTLKLTDRCKFSQKDYEKMRELKRKGLSCKEIAKIYNSSECTIKKITRGSGQKFRNQYSVDSFNSEEHARIKINTYLLNRNIEYAGNYTGCDNPVDLRCKNCGSVFTRSMCSVRNNKVQCPKCTERIRQDKAEKLEEERLNKIALREKARREKAIAKAEKVKARIHECPVCGNITSNRKYCSDRCANKVYNKNKDISRRGKIKSATLDKDISLDKLYRRDSGICYICGLKCKYDDGVWRDGTFIAGDYYPSIEHIKPLSKGGKHSWDNIKLAHRICNAYKGAKEFGA